MKKGNAAALLAVPALVFLSGCMELSQLLPLQPSEVIIGGTAYQTGFYGDLWPSGLSFTGEEYEVDGQTFRRLDWDAFDCVQAPTGAKTGGTIYCRADQWEQAGAYYANGDHFTYYCKIDAANAREEERIYELEDIDLEQWEALARLGQTFRYDPFGPAQNTASELKSVAIDTQTTDPGSYIHFYRESKDGHFVSFRGDRFFILDGALYLGRYHNQSEHTLSAVEIPAETAAYFIALVEDLRQTP